MYGVLGTLEGKQPLAFHPEGEVKKPRRRRCCERSWLWCRDWCGKTNKTVLVMGAIFGLPVFYMTLWLLLSPGLSTLAAHFHPASCTVASSVILEGKSNCTWSSCRQGCTTKELYLCWQVYVFARIIIVNHSSLKHEEGNLSDLQPQYDNVNSFTLIRNLSQEQQNKNEHNFTFLSIPSTAELFNFTDEDPEEHPERQDSDVSVDRLGYNEVDLEVETLARLQVNAEGCGYDSCTEWWLRYGRSGIKYTCYLSADGSLAVPEVDLKKAATNVVLGTMPLILMTVAIVILYIVYCPRKAKKGQYDPKDKELKWEQVRIKILHEVERNHTKHLKLNPILVRAALCKNQVAPSTLKVNNKR